MKRIFTAVILSTVLHFVFFITILHGFNPKIIKNRNRTSTLEVSLLAKIKMLSVPSNLSKKPSPLINLTIDKFISKEDETKFHPSEVYSSHSLNKVNQLDKYYSNIEIERKALPISNIDQSMLGNTYISGLPIKLRIYVNAFGNVTKVEQLAVMEQDQELAKKLEYLLFNTKFLAAKKDGFDVSSYQDMELSMETIPISDLK